MLCFSGKILGVCIAVTVAASPYEAAVLLAIGTRALHWRWIEDPETERLIVSMINITASTAKGLVNSSSSSVYALAHMFCRSLQRVLAYSSARVAQGPKFQEGCGSSLGWILLSGCLGQ